MTSKQMENLSFFFFQKAIKLSLSLFLPILCLQTLALLLAHCVISMFKLEVLSELRQSKWNPAKPRNITLLTCLVLLPIENTLLMAKNNFSICCPFLSKEMNKVFLKQSI